MEQEDPYSNAWLVTALGLATAGVVTALPRRRKRKLGSPGTASLLAHGPALEDALYGPLSVPVAAMRTTTSTGVAGGRGTCQDDPPESPAMFAVRSKPEQLAIDSPRPLRRFGLLPLMLLLAAGLCGSAAWWGTPPSTKPIAEVQLGERVHAVNPLGAESDEPEPTPETHRRVVFRMDKGDGEAIDFELLWPLERIRATGAVPGARIHLGMAELGGGGVAEVLAIGPCPPIARGSGAVVTGRFVHRVERVLEVETDDGTTIGATPNHPFWSEATGSYRPIGEFRVGDRVRTRTGQLARLTSITPRDGPTTVYNVAVHGQHVYHVGPAGVLVHNCNGFDANAGFVQKRFDDDAFLEANGDLAEELRRLETFDDSHDLATLDAIRDARNDGLLNDDLASYEVLNEQAIAGATRTAHRSAANTALLDELESNPQLNKKLSEALGVEDVAAHMRAGRSGLRNPPGTEWHHTLDNPDALELLRKEVHNNSALQEFLHPNGIGGYGTHYAD